ncbi:MAG: hypothetical protein EPN79_16105 [Burkholderiaceae bacterium]|nr:MAG: hypothetical protein EPN79_16105 [Burkholderiaceae bacterium]
MLVPAVELATFRKRLDRLNAKAAKFGLDPVLASEPVFRAYKIEHEENASGTGAHYFTVPLRQGESPKAGQGLVRMAEIAIEYPIVRLGDWRVIAKIEAMGAPKGAAADPGPTSNLVFAVSSDPAEVAVAEAHRCEAIGCEHCGKQRRRIASFILTDGASFKEVGQTCLEDFTGIDPARALFLANLHEFVSFEEYEGRWTPNCIGTREYVTNVLFAVERFGFVSASKARDTGETSTFVEARDLGHRLKKEAELSCAYESTRERHAQTADAVRTWYAMNASPTGFDANVRALLARDELLFDPKHLAFVAGAVAQYQTSRLKREQDAADALNLRHVGEVGLKTTMRLRIEKIIPFETIHGYQWRINCRDESGNRLSWRTSVPPTEAMLASVPHGWFEAQFKVKDHGEYNGIAQTDVTHLKVISWVPVHEPVAEDAIEGPRP